MFVSQFVSVQVVHVSTFDRFRWGGGSLGTTSHCLEIVLAMESSLSFRIAAVEMNEP